MKHTLGVGRRQTESFDEISRSVRTGLNRQSYLNWSLLVIATLIIALGLITVLPPILSERLAAMWPWPKPQLILIVVLSLALLALSGLAHQQRYIAALRKQFEQTQAEEIARAKKHTNRIYALLNVTRMLGTTSDLQSVFDAVTNMCVEGFNCHVASLMLFDKDGGELIVRSASGAPVPPTMLGTRLKLGEGVAGWAAQQREALLIGRDFDPKQYPDLTLKNAALTSAMVVPIILRDELVGVLNVSSRSRKIDYDKDDLRALQVFGENVGSCIRHAEHATWMRQTVQRLQRSVKLKTQHNNSEDRDPKTGEFVIPAESPEARE
ncbi:MAG: GAF domain-containing protein [Candidatus Latescibacterota bacterium]|nr:MAG: GAF domain-containing protein [Candidatus Latescibacterota bacterium]